MPSAKGHVSIHIPQDLHKRFKRVVSFKGETIANVLNDVLEEYITGFTMQHKTAVDEMQELEARMAALRTTVQEQERVSSPA